MISDILQHVHDPYSGAYSRVDGQVVLFSFDPFNENIIKSTLFEHNDSIRSLSFHSSLFCCSLDGKLIQLDEKPTLYSFGDFQFNSIKCIDANTGLLGSDMGDVIIYDIRQPYSIKEFKFGEDYISSISYVNNKTVVSSGDGSLTSIDLKMYKSYTSNSINTSIHSVVQFKNSFITASDMGLHYFENDPKKYLNANNEWTFYDYIPKGNIGELDGAVQDIANASIVVYGTEGLFKLQSNDHQSLISKVNYDYISASNNIIFGSNYDTLHLISSTLEQTKQPKVNAKAKPTLNIEGLT